MIDYFALALTHGLLVIALLRLVRRGDLDVESDAATPAEGAGNDASKAESRRDARARRRRRA
ncbi:hypothetical protein [Qipengyuania spongiae]|uniref:Uncharacterized protein n=1 Tax=Qipengyuania spongiae TaxID=2909673 RepID=A0ABY5SZ60_9SPHN|nr:hypothetical protein [Qipengyuania spongiae]UVI39803.1 hypothetical protein L1F33_02230 [Qipengyuania spongiae]